MREGWLEGVREGGMTGGRDGWKEGGREGGRKRGGSGKQREVYYQVMEYLIGNPSRVVC